MGARRAVRAGGLQIGGGAPVSVQSMTNTKTADVEATVAQIAALAAAGCQLVRLAVPDRAAALALPEIRRRSPVPLAADIHYDHRLALLAVEAGMDKIRLNPGNIGGPAQVQRVADACLRAGVPIRIGVNGGSLEKHILEKYGRPTPQALVESALLHVALLHAAGFFDIVLSIKCSCAAEMVAANRLLAQQTDHPIHLGVTEAGTPASGVVKSAVGIGSLLLDGIGDTIRVSLTADPLEELPAARRILQACGLLPEAPELISCPTCGRTGIDLIPLAQRVEAALATRRLPIRVAVMGCVVNGPGEAREADVGIAGGQGKGVLFLRGEVVRTMEEDQLFDALMQEIDRLQALYDREGLKGIRPGSNTSTMENR
ncbi:MAG: flavodoxin-dependent (E)-4-hydroxy-3-methylbut-2-enyl-diphosphate synthase [Clostridiales bacterium]|nr:flavodoxin-dependent (E)-4-hydroxy-3-methylbut-2-enyl-diphosphate synthase [Clostridiales bacterium]